jgi:hypothetical protein
MHARRRNLKKMLHVCFRRSATVQDAVLMDVGQELALLFGVGRVHNGLLLVNIDTIHVSSFLLGRFVFAPDAGVAWIYFSKRAINSRLAATSACSASISATMVAC